MTTPFDISVSYKLFHKDLKPEVKAELEAKDRSLEAPFAYSFQRRRWTAADLAAHVGEGLAWSVACVRDGHRAAEDFISSQVIGVDLDKDAAIESLLKNSFIGQYAAILYATPNSTPENPRTRVVFVLDIPIKDPGIYRNYVLAMMAKFADFGAIIDTKCKDPARLFYGSTGATGDGLRVTENILPVEVLASLPIPETQPAGPQHNGTHAAADLDEDSRRWHADHALKTMADMVRRAGDDDKHNELLKAARLAGGYIAGGYIAESIAVALLEQEISHKPNVKDFKAAQRTIADGIKNGKAAPMTPEGLQKQRADYLALNGTATTGRAHTNGNGRLTSDEPTSAAPAAPANLIDGPDRPDQASSDELDNELPQPQQPRRVFNFLTLDELMALPAKIWLMRNLFGPLDLAMIFGEEGTGKTFVLIDLIMAAILGVNWCHLFEVARPLSVAYCTGEGRSGIPQRFQAAAARYQMADYPSRAKNLKISLNIPQLFADEAETYITNFIADYRETVGDRLDLLVLDTLHNAAAGSDENQAKDEAKVIAATRLVRDALGCAVLFAHHANKSKVSYRGSSAYAADMDLMIEVSGKSNPRKLSCFKSKDAPAFEPLFFRLDALGDSVSPYWITEGELQAAPKLNDLDTDCLIYLNQYQGEWLKLADVLAGLDHENTPKNREAVRRSLDKIAKGSGVEKQTENPNEKVSKTNPYIYRTPK